MNTRNIPELSAINQGPLKGILATWEIKKKKKKSKISMRFFKLKGSLKCNNRISMKAKEDLAKLTKPSTLEIGRVGRCLQTNGGAMVGLSFLSAHFGGVWVLLLSKQ